MKSRTRNARVSLEKKSRGVRKLKWRRMPEKRWPATVDRAVREKTTEGRTGIRRDNVVEKTWKDLRGDQEEVLSIEKLGGYRDRSKRYQV